MGGCQAVLTPPHESLDAYLDLSNDAIARIVLSLLIEEALRERLAAFRSLPENGTQCDALVVATENRDILVNPSFTVPISTEAE